MKALVGGGGVQTPPPPTLPQGSGGVPDACRVGLAGRRNFQGAFGFTGAAC